MSHSHDRQESRNNRWQQRQREENREQRNRQGTQRRTPAEHSGQQRDDRNFDPETAYRGMDGSLDRGMDQGMDREMDRKMDKRTENRWNPEWDSQSQYTRRNPNEYAASSRRNDGEGEMYDAYYNPRENRGTREDPRNFNPENANREWVSGTGTPPYRAMHPGRHSGSDYSNMGNRYPGMSSANSRFPLSGSDRPGGRGLENSRDYSTYPGSTRSFAGRGPQGYKRSDERIMEDINEEMTRAHDLDPSNITVEAKNGEVVLKGTVSDREAKRRAEEIAESCSGVQDVQNQIRVKRESGSESENDAHQDRSKPRVQNRSDDKQSKIAS